jgi:cytochrome c551/c552
MPAYLNVGGFPIPQPPASSSVLQTGINNLPHPAVASGVACTTCHQTSAGGKNAFGYDHLSTLINSNCSSCHEAGSNLIGTPWNNAPSEATGGGDTRAYTITSMVVSYKGNNRTVTDPNHFYPVNCYQCHVVPAGNGYVTTGSAYLSTNNGTKTGAWAFPHPTSKMTNPSTCVMCHTNGIPN